MRTSACGVWLAAALGILGCQDAGTPYGGPVQMPGVTLPGQSSESGKPAQETPSAEPAKPSEPSAPEKPLTGAKPSDTPVEPARPAPLPEPKPEENASAPADAKPVPGKVEVLIKDKTFQTDSGTGALRVSYDDIDLLKVLNMDPVTVDAVEKMPDWLRNLNGKPVIIRGFMKPDFIDTGITRFIMVRDTGLCCFGPVPRIYDMIQVTLKEGTETDYIELKPFDVAGTFRIEMLADEEDQSLIYGLYFIEDAKIIRKR